MSTNIPTSPPAGMSMQDWGRLVQNGYKQHFLPAEVADPQVNAAMQAYLKAVENYEHTRSNPALTMSEYEAEQRDTEARANALEKGKDAPGTPNLDRYRLEQRDHQRKLEAMAVIIDRREKELVAIERERCDAVRDAHLAAADKLTEKVMAKLEEASADCFELAQHLRKADWAVTFAEGRFRGRPKSWTQDLIVERRQGGEVVFAGDLLATIRDAITAAVSPPEDTVTVLGGPDSKAA